MRLCVLHSFELRCPEKRTHKMIFYKQKGCCIMAEKKTGEAFDVFNEFFKNIRELGQMNTKPHKAA